MRSTEQEMFHTGNRNEI